MSEPGIAVLADSFADYGWAGSLPQARLSNARAFGSWPLTTQRGQRPAVVIAELLGQRRVHDLAVRKNAPVLLDLVLGPHARRPRPVRHHYPCARLIEVQLLRLQAPFALPGKIDRRITVRLIGHVSPGVAGREVVKFGGRLIDHRACALFEKPT